MIVETFEIEETKTDAGIMASDAEAAELIEKLGLEGQRTLLNSDTLTRFPYRKLTQQEGFVYKILCPRTCELKDYKDGIIPVRVLQVAAHAIETGYLNRVEVWYPNNADIKDPVLVGIKGESRSDKEQFLLARWGKELPPIEELEVVALKMRRASLRSKLATIKSKVEGDLAALDTEDLEALVSEPSYYR